MAAVIGHRRSKRRKRGRNVTAKAGLVYNWKRARRVHKVHPRALASGAMSRDVPRWQRAKPVRFVTARLMETQTWKMNGDSHFSIQ